MQTIRLQSHVGDDGVLRLQIPIELQDQDLEILLVYQPIAIKSKVSSSAWPSGFFEETAGCLQDDPLVRPPQGEYETRELLE
ncbi:MAG: hypothetical protein AAF152_06130 [Cyanobacteria bacterium P01_A01_bin.114]